MSQDKNTLDLSATYSCPGSEPFTFSRSLPAPASTSVADRTKYLSSLREAVASAQDQINKELTERMEEDNARVANGGAKGVDEVKEEENYGEEIQEDED